ncbi:MAG: YgiT-type zinc finger protein [Nitrososphaera sp.]
MSTFKCHVCGGETARGEFVGEVLEVDGRRVLVEHIPAQVCARCERRHSRGRIRLLVHGAGRPALLSRGEQHWGQTTIIVASSLYRLR